MHVGASRSSLFGFLSPIVHAQGSQPFEILPPYEPIPLNGLSTAQFQIFVTSPSGQGVRYRVDTEPAVRIRHEGQESVGLAIIRIDAEEHLSKKFEILSPSRPRPVLIRAQALPGGPTMETSVEFVAPYPAHVGIEPAAVHSQRA